MEEILYSAAKQLAVNGVVLAFLVLVMRGDIVPAKWVKDRDTDLKEASDKLEKVREERDQEIRLLQQQLSSVMDSLVTEIKNNYEHRLREKEERYHFSLQVLQSQQRTQESVQGLVAAMAVGVNKEGRDEHSPRE